MNKKILLLRLSPPVYEKNYHPIGCRPPYLLKYIEAILIKKGEFEVKLIDQRITALSYQAVEQTIEQYSPKFIVFDMSILNSQVSINLCNKLKDQGDSEIVIIGAGQEVSADIEAFRKNHPQFDILFAGESELEVVSVIEKIGNGASVDSVKRHYAEHGTENNIRAVQDLDALPFLHYDRESLKGYKFVYPLRLPKKLVWGHMITSRGCPHPCMFCSPLMRESYGTKMRYRSPALIIDEMESLLNLGANIISFDDEDFTTSERHVWGICEGIRRRRLKVPWIIHARVDEVDGSLLKLMSECGCILMRMGIESGNARILGLLDKTKKNATWIQGAEKVVRQAQTCGISVACLFMVGNPSETKEEVQESVDFAKRLNPEIIQVSYFTPMPGTKAFHLYKNRLGDIDIHDLYHYETPKINLSKMHDGDLQTAQGYFYRQFLLRPSFIFKHFIENFLFYMFNYEIFFLLMRSIIRSDSNRRN